MLCVFFSKFESVLQSVCCGIRDGLIVLNPAHHNPRGDTELLCESLNLRFVEKIGIKESLIPVWRDEQVLSKPVRLLFFFTATDLSTALTFGLYEDLLFPMKKDMACLVKEREPEMVITFATKAQLNKCLCGTYPSCGTVEMGARQFRDKNDSDTCSSTDLSHFWFKYIRRFPSESSDLVESGTKDFFLVGLTFNL